MRYHYESAPSEEAKERGIIQAARSQEAASFAAVHNGVLVAGVVQGYGYPGPHPGYFEPSVSALRNLPPDERLSGGLIAAGLLEESILGCTELIGADLVAYLSRVLGCAHSRLNIDPTYARDRLSGTIAVVRVDAHHVDVTTVGCLVAVNGGVEEGAVRQVDRLYYELAERIVTSFRVPREEIHELLLPLRIKQFELQNNVRLSSYDRIRYFQWVLAFLKGALLSDKNDFCESDVTNLFNTVMRRLEMLGTWWYSAIDGTSEPTVETTRYYRRDVISVVAFSPGCKQAPDAWSGIFTSEHLAAVDSAHLARAWVEIGRFNEPGITRV